MKGNKKSQWPCECPLTFYYLITFKYLFLVNPIGQTRRLNLFLDEFENPLVTIGVNKENITSLLKSDSRNVNG